MDRGILGDERPWQSQSVHRPLKEMDYLAVRRKEIVQLCSTDSLIATKVEEDEAVM